VGFLKQHIFLSRCFLFLVLFFFGISSYAQDRRDTIETTDTMIEKTEIVPGNEDTLTRIEPEPESQYFLKKWEGDPAGAFSERHIPDSAVRDLQEDDAFWYANATFKEEEKKEIDQRIPLMERAWFKTLLWLIIISGFTAVIIWWLAESNIGVFRKKDHAIIQDESTLETGDIFAINFQKEIDRAIQKGEFRLAVRLMYLRLLKDLSERNIIDYSQDRTNFDYLSQLNPTAYYTDFFRITRNYEFSWYGQFEVNEKTFQIIQNDFNHFSRKLK
jgi:hypothetical protein